MIQGMDLVLPLSHHSLTHTHVYQETGNCCSLADNLRILEQFYTNKQTYLYSYGAAVAQVVH